MGSDVDTPFGIFKVFLAFLEHLISLPAFFVHFVLSRCSIIKFDYYRNTNIRMLKNKIKTTVMTPAFQ